MKKFSCIVPAYNEEEILPLTLPSIINSVKNVPGYEGRVLVVDNNSNDKTAKIAKELGAEVVFEKVNQISKARNTGGKSCPEDDYLVFIDADTYLNPELLLDSLKMLDSGQFAGGGCLVKMTNNNGKLAAAIWTCITKTTNLAAGAYIFCLNDAFKETGGFNEKIYAGEDVFFSGQLKKWGRKNGRKKFRIMGQHSIITSDRKFKWYSSFQILKIFLIIGIMPWRLRSREKLDFWYRRPDKKDDTNES